MDIQGAQTHGQERDLKSQHLFVLILQDKELTWLSTAKYWWSRMKTQKFKAICNYRRPLKPQ
jgi:hypothetical protein